MLAILIQFPVTIYDCSVLLVSRRNQGKISDCWRSGQQQILFHDEYVNICYQWLYVGTVDYRLIVYSIHCVNYLVVILAAAYFSVISYCAVKSHSMTRRHRATWKDKKQAAESEDCQESYYFYDNRFYSLVAKYNTHYYKWYPCLRSYCWGYRMLFGHEPATGQSISLLRCQLSLHNYGDFNRSKNIYNNPESCTHSRKLLSVRAFTGIEQKHTQGIYFNNPHEPFAHGSYLWGCNIL